MNCNRGALLYKWSTMSKRISDDDEVGKEADIRSGHSSNRQFNPTLQQEQPYPHQHQVHKVGVPAKQNLFKEFRATVKETFFSDEPLRPFKDQTKRRKLVLGLEALFPILRWARDYNLTKFRGDLIAGLTIASLCIPQDLGYAKLANLPGQNGLCECF